MLKSLVFVITVLGVVMRCGYSFGDLSPAAIVLIFTVWLVLLGVTLAMAWPAAVMVVATVVIAIGLILVVFGGDLRIR